MWLPVSPGRVSEAREGPGCPQAFCSACGSRSLHKQQLEDSYWSLSKQVNILREITRRQAESIADLAGQKQQVLAQLRRPLRPSSLERRDLRALSPEPRVPELATMRAEVERLRAELRVWRQEADFEEGRAGDSRAQDSAADLRIAAEQQQWKIERESLQESLEEAQSKVRQLLTLRPSQRELRARSPRDGESARLEVEAERDRQTAASMIRRASSIRREAEDEEHKVQEEAARLAGSAEEAVLLERRLGVETELRRAQQAQLSSLNDTASALRLQVQQAKRENAELQTTLDANQEVLRRLRNAIR